MKSTPNFCFWIGSTDFKATSKHAKQIAENCGLDYNELMKVATMDEIQ
jgi:hypothetical protein